MQIITATYAHEALKNLFSHDAEEFWALALGPSKTLLKRKMLFRGTVDECLVHPRDLFRFACSANASSLIIAHNHPSGDPQPSRQDLAITKKLIEAGHLLQIPILDHLIVIDGGYSSMAQDGWFSFDP